MDNKTTRIKILQNPIFIGGAYCGVGSVVDVPDHVARFKIGNGDAEETTEKVSVVPGREEKAVNPAAAKAEQAVARK